MPVVYRENSLKNVSSLNSADFPQLDFDKRLIQPFTMLVAGITGAGKSQFVKKLLENQKSCIDKKIHKIFYHYSIWQSAYRQMNETIPNIVFRKGIARNWEKLNENVEEDDMKPYIIVIDDLMIESLKEESTSKLYTVGSHHKNISVISLSQNLFPKLKEARTVSINCHYMVLYKNPRDKSQVKTLAKQVTDSKGDYRHFLDSYADATKKPYSYLFLDYKPLTPEELKLRAGILEKFEHVAYLPADYPLSI
jgi:hypothetical protein